MREKARRELAKREPKSKSSTSSLNEEEEKVPSFFSGMMIILFGSLTFSIFYASGQTLIGILGSAPFILIGMSRIARNSAARSNPGKLSTKLN